MKVKEENPFWNLKLNWIKKKKKKEKYKLIRKYLCWSYTFFCQTDENEVKAPPVAVSTSTREWGKKRSYGLFKCQFNIAD